MSNTFKRTRRRSFLTIRVRIVPRAGNLLTDAQIMTSDDFGMEMFGPGNVKEGVRDFEAKHKCNRFCRWYDLKPFGQVAGHQDTE
ncbi:hypothetical protein DFP72DRAFT_1075028 [Ephemerocybe angulata]|uniref:Alpha-type protein kinase domain-containing protein n=1 Tax=Ephemerocybe angulata TaxID=980116 RepID=A0A8H6HIP5_9AGAR|nr:hypothetical protein DFP72DRAFT_1075028 [Tulosesus angulatus]